MVVDMMNLRRQSRFKEIVLNHLLKMKGRLCLAALCLVGYVAIDLLKPWPLKFLFDYVLLQQPLPSFLSSLQGTLQDGLLLPLGIVAGSIICISALSGVFSYGQLYLTSKVGFLLSATLRNELFSRLQRLSLSFHHQTKSGELLTNVSSDTAALRDVFADWALTMAGHGLMLFGMMVIMFVLNWKLALVAMVTLPMMGALLFVLIRKVKATAQKQRKHEGAIASHVNEVLGAISLVQAFGREEHEESRLQKYSDHHVEQGIHTARLTASVSRMVHIVEALGTAGIVLFGGWLVLGKQMTPGDLLVFLSYGHSLYKPLRNLSSLSVKFSRAMVSAKRVADILDIEPEIRDLPDARQASALQGDIAFHQVAFGYERNTNVLHGVSFHIDAGQKVALVGSSGAGKSTIVNLILRLYEPQSGSIMIDGINSAQYKRESLRQHIGIVLQDTVLFGASIAENISYGKPDATREEIERAAALSYAHDFIAALPDGYDTILGERGNTLSGGQRQRICLARAIIKQPSILILDEPTSAVDPASAALIRDTVARLQTGKTTLVIAHQFVAMDQFDQILVLENGRLVEQGTHLQLVARKGQYYALLAHQAREAQWEDAGASSTLRPETEGEAETYA
ncbi:MAG: ABC transporter ATP-binding protein [Nitrospira sp. CG24C]|nr:MAG: ABC transporter ATP-binding protein [Nitrospira sp. CG24C]